MPDKIANKIIGVTLLCMLILFIIVLGTGYFGYQIPAQWIFLVYLILFVGYRFAWQSKISSINSAERPSNINLGTSIGASGASGISPV